MAFAEDVEHPVYENLSVHPDRAPQTAPLLGMGMLQTHRLVMDVERRGVVKITRVVRRRPK